MKHSLFLGAILAAFWLIISGHYTPLIMGLGAVSVVVVVLLAERMRVVDEESQPIHLFPAIIPFWFWLLKEIIVANIDVFIRIWRGKSAIAPERVTYQTHATTDLGKVIFANSVTLTPGTISVDVKGSQVDIHALTPHGTSGLKAIDDMVQKVES